MATTTKPDRRRRTRGNGAGTVFKRGNTWSCQITVGVKTVVGDDGRARVQTIRVTKGGFAKKSEALAYIPTLQAEGRRARKVMTVRQIYEAWWDEHDGHVVKSTMDCYRAAWNYFAPLHGMAFPDLELDDWQECIDECPRGKRTKENMKALAGLLCKYAVPRHQTDMNYGEYLRTGDDKKGTRPAFTAEQVERIREQVGTTPNADAVLVMIYTGLRTAELVGIRTEDYRDGVIYGGVKTEAGVDRAVPVHPCVRALVDARAARGGEYLFQRDDGRPLSTNYFRDVWFYPVLAAAGIQPIPPKGTPATYVPYSCRHTFANMLKAAPGADKDKAGLIGHEDYRTTKRYYQSAEIEAMRAIIEAMPGEM